MDLQNLVRSNIWNLKAYSSARDDFKGEASVYLDANENPLSDRYNRYPDPLQWKLKEKVANVKGVAPEQLFFGNGSDEPIDLVIRIFCEPTVDNIVAIDPSYGMYQVCADINNVAYRKVLLNDDYSLDPQRVLDAVDDKTKLVFLCSPNNPSANLLNKDGIGKILLGFKGIVIIDEAYIDFTPNDTWVGDLAKYPNLIILQTFSKAWGLAAVRLGMAFASPEIIRLFNKVKYPYNVNQLTQEFVLEEIDKVERKNKWVNTILEGRCYLEQELPKLSFVEKIFPSDANFVLVKVIDANGLYHRLVNKGVIVRNRNSVSLCNGCIRVTVGTDAENKALIEALKSLSRD